MSEALSLMEQAARCFDLAKSAKNQTMARTLTEIGMQYVKQARELRLAEHGQADTARAGTAAAGTAKSE